MERRLRWPAGDGRRTCSPRSKTPTRPLFACSSRAPSRPRALLTTSANRYLREHDRGPLEHPGPPESGRDDCLVLIGSRLSIRATAGGAQGQGPGDTVLPALPAVIAHGRDFAPTPSAPGTSCRDTTLFPVWRDLERDRCRRRGAHLHGVRCDRVVRRRISAKRSDAHQPEGPSIAGSLANERRESTGQRAGRQSRQRLFHHRVTARGTPARETKARSWWQGRAANRPVAAETAAPPTISAFE